MREKRIRQSLYDWNQNSFYISSFNSKKKKKKNKSKDFPNSGKKAINTFFLQVDKKNCFQLE